MFSILLVDDQPAIRQGLSLQIATEPDLTVVGHAGSGHEGLALAELLQPDVIILDVAMPDMDGIAVLPKLAAVAPRSAVVVLTIHDDCDTRARALTAGARAFVAKGTVESLLSAIFSVVGSRA